MFHRLLALPDDVRAAFDPSSLRLVLHGAAPCPVDVKRRMIEWWGPVIEEYYAATEGGGTYITAKEWLAKLGSVGKARMAGWLQGGGRGHSWRPSRIGAREPMIDPAAATAERCSRDFTFQTLLMMRRGPRSSYKPVLQSQLELKSHRHPWSEAALNSYFWTFENR